ncbi:Na/Pi cotransporter family protein [bacterium]|nr:Na/Pi cotransporter family protein [bacterium]
MNIFSIFQLFGGLGLFIFGMSMMSDGLQRGAGSKLKMALSKLTTNQFSGMLVGTLVALLIHSSATTVMIVGFINAGLISLVKSVGMMLGANIGTTLSMQLVSFDFSKYAPLAVAIGMMFYLVGKKDKYKHIGYIILGFGVLFIGMELMKNSVRPLRYSETFQNLLSHTDGSTIGGMFLGLLVATLITGVIQSSGAMIGILFALASEGVFTQFSQIFPLVLGAHIGTCATPLLGSIGTNLNAKRSAFSHLFFNIFGAILAILIYKYYAWLIPKTTTDLTRQIANLHTIVQITNSIILLPLSAIYINKFIMKIIRGKEGKQESSFLEPSFLDTPEMALMVSLKELRRIGLITRKMLQNMMRGFLTFDDNQFIQVLKAEESVDNLKLTFTQYILDLSTRTLSRRQSIMLQKLNKAINNFERIGDHIESLVSITKNKMDKKIWFSKKSMDKLVELYLLTDKIIIETCNNLNPDNLCTDEKYKEYSNRIMETLSAFEKAIVDFNQDILDKKEEAILGLYFAKYVEAFEKIVKHARNIVMLENEPLFYLKKYKYERKTSPKKEDFSEKTKDPKYELYKFDENILHNNDSLIENESE